VTRALSLSCVRRRLSPPDLTPHTEGPGRTASAPRSRDPSLPADRRWIERERAGARRMQEPRRPDAGAESPEDRGSPDQASTHERPGSPSPRGPDERTEAGQVGMPASALRPHPARAHQPVKHPVGWGGAGLDSGSDGVGSCTGSGSGGRRRSGQIRSEAVGGGCRGGAGCAPGTSWPQPPAAAGIPVRGIPPNRLGSSCPKQPQTQVAFPFLQENRQSGKRVIARGT
jgi:hypothetical protein